MNIKTVRYITPDSGSEMKGGKSVQTPSPRLRSVQFFIFEILGDDLPKSKALYRDATLVVIRMGTNMAAGKHLSLSFDTKA